MQEGIKTFAERPLTGIGAGQFQNYDPPGRKEAWRETHNAPIQVAAETGIVGLGAFLFLVIRAGDAPDPLGAVMSDRDRADMNAHTVAMTAGFFGWLVCSFFASVAYNWTFYYLLALIVASREMVSTRLGAAVALTAQQWKTFSARATGRTRPVVPGAA
jgi:O-antigen ligase